jgi:heme/copper-type cytochrome/quinol oxidase subunit 1
MDSIINKPYKAIWYSILFLFGLSIIGWNNTIDIQLHDTYFVIASIHIGILFSIYLGVIGIIYWLIRKKQLVDWMTVIHVVITISTFALIIITGLIFQKIIEGDFETFRTVNQILFVVILIALLSQLIFIINLTFGLIRNKPKN